MRIINTFKSAIKNAQNIVITTHVHPDADGIGSEIALCLALRSIGKNAICVNDVELLERYKYLDPDSVIMSFGEFKKKYKNVKMDLCIVADTNSLSRIGHHLEGLAQNSKSILFIDHHPCPKAIEAIHCIDTSAAATGELVGKLIKSIDVKFTQKLALPLYTSILIDTSSFRYPTVSGNTHRLIGELMDAGVRPPEAYNAIYGTKKISYMQFLGIVLSSAQSSDDGGVAWIKLTEKDLEKHGVDKEDTHGFINHLLILDNIKVACMFRQIDGHVKISFRSAGDVDVGVIAQALGGGGHDHSAATIVEDTNIESVIKETIEKIQLMLRNY